MNILKDIGAYLAVIPAYILFASVVPIIPFFIAMGGMYAVLKYVRLNLENYNLYIYIKWIYIFFIIVLIKL